MIGWNIYQITGTLTIHKIPTINITNFTISRLSKRMLLRGYRVLEILSKRRAVVSILCHLSLAQCVPKLKNREI